MSKKLAIFKQANTKFMPDSPYSLQVETNDTLLAKTEKNKYGSILWKVCMSGVGDIA